MPRRTNFARSYTSNRLMITASAIPIFLLRYFYLVVCQRAVGLYSSTNVSSSSECCAVYILLADSLILLLAVRYWFGVAHFLVIISNFLSCNQFFRIFRLAALRGVMFSSVLKVKHTFWRKYGYRNCAVCVTMSVSFMLFQLIV